MRRCQVLRGGRGADEHRRLSDAGHDAHAHQPRQRMDESVADDRKAERQRPTDHQHPSSAAIADPPGHRSQHGCGDGERADHHTNRCALPAQVVLHVDRQHRRHDPDRHEVGER